MIADWMIAYDPDGTAEEAIHIIAPLAAAAAATGRRARIVLCHVVAPSSLMVSPDVMGLPDINATLAAAAEDAGARLQSRARALQAEVPGVVVEARLCRGAPGPTLVEEAERQHVDAVALGSHDRKGLNRVVFGSVASYVASHCRKPVMIVHPPDAARGVAAVM